MAEHIMKSFRYYKRYYAWRMFYYVMRFFEAFVVLYLETKALFTRTPIIERRPPIKPLSADSLLLRPAHELSRQIRSGKLTSEELVRAAIKRIKEVNPSINAIADVRFQDAIVEARAIDEKIASELLTARPASGRAFDKFPLMGIPVTVKDSIAVKDLIQSAGSVFRKNAIAPRDAKVVTNLRAAGLIPIAATNVPDLLFSTETRNKIRGITANPHDFRYTCGGSTGGEGALIATGGSLIGVGSDLGGSCRIPAMYCGLFGHKTSPHIVPNEGNYPPADDPGIACMVSFGPIARHATDLKPMLQCMAEPSRLPLLRFNDPVDLSSLKIYFMLEDGENPISSSVWPSIKKAQLTAIEYLASLGISVEQVNISDMRMALLILNHRRKKLTSVPGLRQMMENGKIGTKTRDLFHELYKSLKGKSNHNWDLIALAILEQIWPGKESKEHEYVMNMFNRLKNRLHSMLGENGIFIYPTLPHPAHKHYLSFFRSGNLGYTTVFNVLEMPATTIPMGRDPSTRLPIGIQVAACQNNDRLWIAVAEELERRFGGWVQPGTK